MSKLPNKRRVVLLTPVLSHYRYDVYHQMAASEGFDWVFVAGVSYQNIKSIEDLNSRRLPYWSFLLFRHRFYYLLGSIKEVLRLRPDVIISSGIDFHLLHTLLLFFIYRLVLRRKFIWWSQGTPGHQGRFGWLARKYAYKWSSGVLLYNQEGYENLKAMGLPTSRLQVVGNCLNEEDYGFLHASNMKETRNTDNFTLLFSGRLTPKANLEILIKALGRLKEKGTKNIHCLIVGGGDISIYKSLARKYAVTEMLTFTGPKYGNEAHRYFQKADLFVYPGGIGLSILHAMSFGLPVITTDDYGKHFPEVELLRPGKNGDVYEDNNAEDLANKILLWEKKLSSEELNYKASCVQSIKKHGYLPELVSSKIISFISHE